MANYVDIDIRLPDPLLVRARVQSCPEDIIRWLQTGVYELVQIDEYRELYERTSRVTLNLVQKARKPSYVNMPCLTP